MVGVSVVTGETRSHSRCRSVSLVCVSVTHLVPGRFVGTRGLLVEGVVMTERSRDVRT